MEYDTFIGDLQINQRFTLGGDVYTVRNVDYDEDYGLYKVTARGTVVSRDLELRVPAMTPFVVLR